MPYRSYRAPITRNPDPSTVKSFISRLNRMKHLIACFLSIVISYHLTTEGSRSCAPCECNHGDEYGGVLVKCSGLNLTTVPKNLPETTTTLLLNQNRISNLSGQPFRSFPNLTKLDLSRNCASETTLCSFYSLGQLVHLHHLNLSGNQFLNFDPKLFSPLAVLRNLDISFIHHESISSHLFLDVTKYLSRNIEVMRYNYIRKNVLDAELNMAVFLHLNGTSLRELYFNAFAKTAVKSNTLLDIPRSLEVFSFQNFFFLSIQGLWPISQSNIRNLDISGTEVGSNDICTFILLPMMIETLTCRNCPCKYVPPYISERFVLSRLTLTHSNIGELIETGNRDLFNLFPNIEYIDISSNGISHLPSYVVQSMFNLRFINFSDNQLQTLDVDISNLMKLETVDLSYNRLYNLPESGRVFIERLPNVSVLVHGNPLVCSCGELDFLQWVQRYQSKFSKLSQTYCKMSTGEIAYFNQLDDILQQLEEECKSYIVEISVSVFVVACIITAVGGCLAYRNRWRLRYMYHVGRRNYRRRPVKGVDQYQYDVFVSYSDEDRRFVIDSMMIELEDKCGLKMCIHHRDFLPGEVIATNIVNAIENSRKTLVVLSPTFLTSDWCEYEYNMARQVGVSRRQEIVLVVLYKKVPMKDLPKDMALMFKRNCYIEYNEEIFGNEVFWERVVESIRTDRPQH